MKKLMQQTEKLKIKTTKRQEALAHQQTIKN
jgi:hypothetical protein